MTVAAAVTAAIAVVVVFLLLFFFTSPIFLLAGLFSPPVSPSSADPCLSFVGTQIRGHKAPPPLL